MPNAEENQIYEINWKFVIGAKSKDEARLKLQETMAKFAEFMGWPKPDQLRMKV